MKSICRNSLRKREKRAQKKLYDNDNSKCVCNGSFKRNKKFRMKMWKLFESRCIRCSLLVVSLDCVWISFHFREDRLLIIIIIIGVKTVERKWNSNGTHTIRREASQIEMVCFSLSFELIFRRFWKCANDTFVGVENILSAVIRLSVLMCRNSHGLRFLRDTVCLDF